MQNIKLHFSHPWLLLLLIPAIFFTLFSYFRLNKRYRCTRNRIISIVCHLCVMFFAIFTLAGFVVRYQIPNETNEIVIVVDKSNSEGESQDAINNFVYDIIEEGQYDNFNIGIVNFGFDQKYVVPMTSDLTGAYDRYIEAEAPDVTATNLADAVSYAKTLFTNPKSGKIVLITDGKETDKSVQQVIGGISMQGIVVDVAFVPSTYTGNDAQIVDIVMPDYYVGVGVECSISVVVESKDEQKILLSLYDNGTTDEEIGTQLVNLPMGQHTITFQHVFQDDDLHEIRFKIDKQDAVAENNEYCTYYFIETFDKILVVERTLGESTALIEFLNSDPKKQYAIQTACVTDAKFPNSVDALRAYDQVILNNIANKDMPEGFVQQLSSYVQDYGGGLFTVGGNDEDGKANTYNRDDLYGTVYQSMLPVEAVDYTPPVAVMLILDRSGSMLSLDDKGNSFFDGAKAGAIACLDALSERDYIGVMTLDENPEMILPLTERTKEQTIKDVITSMGDANLNHNTFFTNAISAAGTALNLYRDRVAKRHIIIISDCGVASSDTNYKAKIAELHNLGITVSIVGINQASNANMEEAVALGGGKFYPVNNVGNLVAAMEEDLHAPRIKDVNDEEFYPLIYNLNSPIVRDLERGEEAYRNNLTVKLGGFYGVKIREGADMVLAGNYNVPIYAQWKYGKGTVGSFMCDLQGSKWSSAFMQNVNGQKFIRNAVDNLMPTENIRPKSINVNLKEDNYINVMSALTTLEDGQKLVGQIVKTNASGDVVVSLNEVTNLAESNTTSIYVTMALSAENNYTRCEFVAKESGVYKIILKKVDALGNVLDERVVYKAFSYSKEYDSIPDKQNTILKQEMEELATKANGNLIEDLQDSRPIFEDFVKVIDCVYDPRFLFMILAIVLFLCDIAVRKFKFKWLHEIIRDKKKNLK